VISLDALQLRSIAADVLEALQVGDTVSVLDVRKLSDGAWSIEFEDRWPDTRFSTFTVEVERDWSREAAARELRTTLREKLWICPLCQRRALIRRLVDLNVFRVECRACGLFEIDSDVMDLFRSAYEDGDDRIVAALSRLSDATRRAGSPLSLGVERGQILIFSSRGLEEKIKI